MCSACSFLAHLVTKAAENQVFASHLDSIGLQLVHQLLTAIGGYLLIVGITLGMIRWWGLIVGITRDDPIEEPRLTLLSAVCHIVTGDLSHC